MRTLTNRVGFAACVLGLLIASAAAQTAEPQRLRVTTRLVEVNVLAESKNGDPAVGLTREDFLLFDEGRPQEIEFFSAEKLKPPAPPKPLPPNIFTNRLEYLAGPVNSATVILFDGLNTPLTDQAYARQQIIKFLKEITPEDRVALYVMGRGPRVLQDFTSDSAALLRALADYKAAPVASLEAPLYDPGVSGADHFDTWLGELSFNLYSHFARDRAYRTVRALIAIAQHLERLPGRKNLIWVSGSFPIWIGDNSVPLPRKAAGRDPVWPEIERAARAFNRSNLAIYPVDARGLMAPQEYRADRAEAVRDSLAADQAIFSTMRTLAERTGGRAFYQNNDLRAAMRKAADDARLTYTLAYRPSHGRWDGKFREIKIQVKREGTELRYRRGYFAQPDEPGESWYRKGILDAAMWSPMEATRLGLTVRVSSAGANSLSLAVQVDPNELACRPDGNVWECGMDIWLVQLDGRELHINTVARTSTMRLEQPTYLKAMEARGLVFMEKLDASPKAKLVRLLLRDVSSGALGSVTIPIQRFLATAGKDAGSSTGR